MQPMEILVEVKKVIDQGHGDKILNLIDKLKNKSGLPDALQEEVDKLPNNPIEGKEVYDKLNAFEDATDKIDLVDELLENPDQYPAKQLAQFIYEVEDHITSFKDGDDFKTTAATENAKLLSRKDYKAMKKIIFKDGKFNITQETVAEAMDFGLEVSGLNKDDLTKWECDLVGIMMYESCLDTWKHSMGKQ